MGKDKGKSKGKKGRGACIFPPLLLTIAALPFLIIMGYSCTTKDNDFLRNTYFLRAGNSNRKIYHVGLFSYCSGTFKNGVNFDVRHPSKTDNMINCTPHETLFSVDLVETWGFNNGKHEVQLHSILSNYQKATKWICVAYILSVTLTSLRIVAGLLAFKLKGAIKLTTILSVLNSIFTIALGLTATIMYYTLVHALNHEFTENQLHSTLGLSMFLFLALAVILSLAATIISLCCSRRAKGPKASLEAGGNDPSQNNIQNIYLTGPGTIGNAFAATQPAGPPPNKKGRE